MATTLGSAKVGASASFDFSSTVDIGLVTHAASFGPNYVFTDGTGANQAKVVFADERTLAASATEDLDVAGGLTDAFGNTITMTKIKAIIVQAASGNTNDVLVGGATAAIASIFGDVSDVIRVKPGGLFMVVAPDSTGYAVSAGTADDLKIANSAGSTSVTYKVIIIGVV